MTTDNNPLHPVVNKIKEILEENNIDYDYMEHKPVRTSEEAAKVREGKYSIEQGAKALIVRIKVRGGNKYFAMFVVPGHLRFDMDKSKALFNAKDIRFATEKEVSKITNGVKPGGVPPFGNLFNIDTFADKKMFDYENIIFNCGDKRASIAIKPSDFRHIVEPQVVDLT